MGIEEEIKDIRNDVEHIKQDIDSINRVQVLASSGAILQDIRSVVGRSSLMVAALFLAKDWVSSGDLAGRLDISQGNLNKVVNPLLDRGLIYREKRGKMVFYKRATRLDLVGFESVKDFKALFEEWSRSKGEVEPAEC